jgi:hypothetical protein
MEGLGAFGFWLAVGVVIAAAIVSGGRKEREREREKQETLRELARLEADGKLTPETLAYVREKDAADRYLMREALGLTMFDGPGAVVGMSAIIVGVLAFIGGLIAMGLGSERTDSWFVPLALMFVIWAGGFFIAWLIVRLSRDRKNGPPPGA